MYFENTVDVFSFVRYESGEFVDPDLDAAGEAIHVLVLSNN
jgi:hypothetical protein